MMIFLFFCLLPFAFGGVLWKSKNCNMQDGQAVQGYVVDAICANEMIGDVCSNYSQSECEATSNQHRCSWKDSKCKFNRDRLNNVCFLPFGNPSTLPDSTQSCADILKGKCPRKLQVPIGCCNSDDLKYNSLLKSAEGFVCCNAPCKGLEDNHGKDVLDSSGQKLANGSTCDIISMDPGQCSPQARSSYGFGGMGFGGMGGLMKYQAQMKAFGMFSGAPVQGGTINPMYGHLPMGLMSLGMGMGPFGNMQKAVSALEEVPVGESKNKHVDEITGDDFMEVLLGALSSDKNVVKAKKEVFSDPWLGKQVFGNEPSGYNLMDPWKIINIIYSNPFNRMSGMGGMGHPGMGGMGGLNPFRFGGSYGGFGLNPYGGYGVPHGGATSPASTPAHYGQPPLGHGHTRTQAGAVSPVPPVPHESHPKVPVPQTLPPQGYPGQPQPQGLGGFGSQGQPQPPVGVGNQGQGQPQVSGPGQIPLLNSQGQAQANQAYPSNNYPWKSKEFSAVSSNL